MILLIALYVHPKNSVAITALVNSRLGLENKFLENKSGQIFAFDTFTLQNLDSLFNKSVKLIALYVHPKNSIAIMALVNSRLGLENKFSENKSGQIFAFDTFTLQNLANKSRDV